MNSMLRLGIASTLLLGASCIGARRADVPAPPAEPVAPHAPVAAHDPHAPAAAAAPHAPAAHAPAAAHDPAVPTTCPVVATGTRRPEIRYYEIAEA